MQTLNFLKKFLTQTIKFALDLVFPRECVMCGVNGKYLCDLCEEKALKYGEPFYDGDVFAAYKYENGLFAVTLVEKLKYKFSEEIAEILGRILYKRFEGFLRGAAREAIGTFTARENFAITFIPIHKKRHLWRGFNQAQMIAKVLADLSGLPLTEYLIKIVNTPPQVGLKRAERLKNLAGAFALKTGAGLNMRPSAGMDVQSGARLSGSGVRLPKNIILIDDVSTTGTTIKECAKVLKAGGAERVVGMVVCKRV